MRRCGWGAAIPQHDGAGVPSLRAGWRGGLPATHTAAHAELSVLDEALLVGELQVLLAATQTMLRLLKVGGRGRTPRPKESCDNGASMWERSSNTGKALSASR